MKYVIKRARTAVEPLGPGVGVIVSEVELQPENGVNFFVCLSEVDGNPMICRTEDSTLEQQIAMCDDEDFWENLNSHVVADGDYEEILGDEDAELYEVYRYLIYMVRCESGEEKSFAAETIGKTIGEFEIPMCDVFEEFLEAEDEIEDEEISSQNISEAVKQITEE